MSARKAVVHCWFGLLALLTVWSLLSTLFLRERTLLGALAFGLLGLSALLRSRSRTHELVLPNWAALMLFVVFLAALVVCAAISPSIGAPELKGQPVFAERDAYLFSRSGQAVERWRFVAVSTAFLVGWHTFVAAMVANEWLLAVRAGRRQN